MRSTFMGLETARRGLFTQQSALYTTGHNISNANTVGYSRQRVNMDATIAYKAPNLNTVNTVGQLGTGVEAGSIQRMRDQFIDKRFRYETSQFGYWETRTRTLHEMEDVLDAHSDFNLKSSMAQFWAGMQDVADKSDDMAIRGVTVKNAEQLADSFNYVDTKLREIQRGQAQEMDVMVKKANSLLSRIAALNKQIKEIEPIGQIPNDLYDARDVLIDDLNDIIPVEIMREPLEGLAQEPAMGGLTVTMKGVKGPDGKPLKLVESREYVEFKIPTVYDSSTNKGPEPLPFDYMQVSAMGDAENPPSIEDNGAALTIDQSKFYKEEGRLLSLINSFGYKENGTGDVKGTYPDMLDQLDTLAKVFAEQFNDQHKKGYTLKTVDKDGNELTKSEAGKDFFVSADGKPISAGNISVSSEIKKDPSKIAASTEQNQEGDGKNALVLAQLQEKAHADLKNGSFETFYQGLIGELATTAEDSNFKTKQHGVQLLNATNDRAAMSSVSLDEEMTGLITFQQAYNASARMITVVDETLDKIINGMGRVGL